MHLISYLDPRDIRIEQRILTKQQVYQQMVETICHNHPLPVCGNELLELILQRDQESATAYPSGLAIPHIRMDGFKDTVVGMTFLQNPIDINGFSINWVVLIITDKTSSKLYLNMVSALLALSKDKETVQALSAAQDGHGVMQQLKHLDVEIKKDLTIADIMVKDPVSVRPDAFLRELSDLMNERVTSVLPVTDAQGTYLGDVTILNFLKVGVPNYMMMIDNLNFLLSFEPLEYLFEKLDEVRVSEIMGEDDVFLRPEASIIEAVSEMIKHEKRYMSVVDKGKLVGVVTAMDIFRKVIQA